MERTVLFLFILISANSLAGPPYDTDDPEPVEFRHWEVYFSTHAEHYPNQWQGTAPHFEVNYGVIPDLQLYIIVPLAFSAYKGGSRNYGYGDTEIGAKYRFVHEGTWCPQIGIFPLIELPSGNVDKELGNGKTQVYIPIWLQKTIGRWTSYAGAGYWINPGTGKRNYQFYGWQVQYQLNEKMNLGTEFYHVTASEINGIGETRFNIGSVIDLSKVSHLLFSIGSSINGNTRLQCYTGYQLTFGKG